MRGADQERSELMPNDSRWSTCRKSGQCSWSLLFTSPETEGAGIEESPRWELLIERFESFNGTAEVSSMPMKTLLRSPLLRFRPPKSPTNPPLSFAHRYNHRSVYLSTLIAPIVSICPLVLGSSIMEREGRGETDWEMTESSNVLIETVYCLMLLLSIHRPMYITPRKSFLVHVHIISLEMESFFLLAWTIKAINTIAIRTNSIGFGVIGFADK